MVLVNRAAMGGLYSGQELKGLQETAVIMAEMDFASLEKARDKALKIKELETSVMKAAIRMSLRTDSPDYLSTAVLDWFDGVEDS